ncbi:small G protein signaling modulator 1 isoform X2 [Drosophila simulans]|uniref:small G protein signaling modulator 1 isoform X2 n=1 Tax=Drosophila simulans TaxID=7240 RepID=UPI00192D1ACA|nr:small G protein signaling modulator 1 isoform X2 [Drosophila simulans]
MVQGNADGSDYKERLIASVKKEVKQLMEEAVTKKYVHEESSSVTSLCGAVEACLSQGLRRRALGLFKTSSTTALLHKIAKSCPEAEHISKLVQEIEASDPSKRSSSSSDSFQRPPMLKKSSSNSMSTGTNAAASTSSASASISVSASTSSMSLASMKYLWIRLALYEKRLTKIIEYLVSNASSFYDRDSLVADPDYGSILSSLLVGPCALEFTRAKTADHYWTDPHADELVQRHRISSCRRSSSTCSRPAIINFKRSLNTSSDEAGTGSFKSIASASVAKDYVESLHQNAKATLLYGKNNVQVLPKDVAEPMPGYLSLHQHIQTLTIKWTPNQLMNGYTEAEEAEDIDKDAFWAYALNINVDEIVYVHCHQSRGEDSGGTVILVGQDGVQRPPIHFPEGGHMQQFLSCLETGLLPHGQLDPPLWSQRGIGKMFLWPRSMRRRILPSVMESVDETPIDYVFRIVSKSRHEEFAATHSILDFVRSTPRRAQLSSCSTTGSSDCSNKSLSIDQFPLESPLLLQQQQQQQQLLQAQSTSIEMVCSTMRRQIISRAFYGWLAYCRHLSTVRTHLSGLVHGRITPEMKADEEGLTKERWQLLNVNGVLDNATEFYRLVYFGGVQPELRQEVWPYLLGHYAFGSTTEDRKKQDETCKHYYETTMSEWLAVDAIVQQREKEKTARAVAKLSSGSNSGNERTVREADLEAGGELENEVFEDISDISDPGDLEFDEQQQQQQQAECAVSGNHLTVKPIPRAMKTSTDSGHVDEGESFNELDEPDEEDNKPKQQQDEKNPESENQVPEYRKLEEQINQEPSCSASTASSYETVGPGDVHQRPTSDTRSVLSPEYLSADDLQLPDDEEAVRPPPPAAAAVIITKASVDITNWERSPKAAEGDQMSPLEEQAGESGGAGVNMDALQQPKSACASPASSNGGVYSDRRLSKTKPRLSKKTSLRTEGSLYSTGMERKQSCKVIYPSTTPDDLKLFERFK